MDYRVFLFILLGLLAWVRAQQIIKRCKNDPDTSGRPIWRHDSGGLIGYAAGGAFLA